MRDRACSTHAEARPPMPGAARRWPTIASSTVLDGCSAATKTCAEFPSEPAPRVLTLDGYGLGGARLIRVATGAAAAQASGLTRADGGS